MKERRKLERFSFQHQLIKLTSRKFWIALFCCYILFRDNLDMMFGKASLVVGAGCVTGILFYLVGETVIDRITHIKVGNNEIVLNDKENEDE
jgi:hypothetical protein